MPIPILKNFFKKMESYFIWVSPLLPHRVCVCVCVLLHKVNCMYFLYLKTFLRLEVTAFIATTIHYYQV
jgi:hypothetical protein